MGFPITAEKGLITSWGSAEDVTQLIGTAIRPYQFGLTIDSDIQDVTGFAASLAGYERIGGLRSGTFDFEGYYPKTAPVLGDTGGVTFSSGYVQIVRSWFVELDFGEEDITSQPTVAGGWRRFMPSGVPSWSGGYMAHLVSDTPASLPLAVNSDASAATAVFKVKECTTADASLTGAIAIKSMTHSQGVRGKVPVNYTFDGHGALTSVAGTTGGPAILPAGAIDKADWDTTGDGIPDVTAVLQTYTGRTYTGAAFLRRLRIECEVDKPIKITGSGRFSDAITTA